MRARPADRAPGTTWALAAVVCGAALAVFVPALGGAFLYWDDTENFLGNPGYRGLGWAQLRWMWTSTLGGHWIPLTWMSLGLDYVLWGMDPRGYHATSLLLHAGSAGLLFLAARRLLQAAGLAPGAPRELGAAAAALAWAVHPLRAESVAWLTERRDVLCGAFLLLAVLAYLRGVGRAGAARRGWLGLSLLAFAGALLSKAVAMPLPAALLLLDVYPLGRHRREGWRRILAEKIPCAVLAGAAAAVALAALGAPGVAVTAYAAYGPGARAAMVAWSLAFYPWKFLWPAGLSPLYELPPRVDPLEWRFLLPALALVAVTAALVLLRRRWPAGLAAWVWSALFVLPVGGVVHAGHQLAHDRYSYLSGLGLAVAAGGALAWGLVAARGAGPRGRLAAGALLALAGLWLLALGVAGWRQASVWRDSEALWRQALAVNPACVLCLTNLGQWMLDQRRLDEAEALFREAARLRPERAAPLNNLGVALMLRERHAEAAGAFREALGRAAPGEVAPAANLGLVLVRLGRHDEAIPLLRDALGRQPGIRMLRAALYEALVTQARAARHAGRGAEALALEREAAALGEGGGGQRSTTSGR